MKPAGNWTQIEYFDDSGEKPYLKEYEGRGWHVFCNATLGKWLLTFKPGSRTRQS